MFPALQLNVCMRDSYEFAMHYCNLLDDSQKHWFASSSNSSLPALQPSHLLKLELLVRLVCSLHHQFARTSAISWPLICIHCNHKVGCKLKPILFLHDNHLFAYISAISLHAQQPLFCMHDRHESLRPLTIILHAPQPSFCLHESHCFAWSTAMRLPALQQPICLNSSHGFACTTQSLVCLHHSKRVCLSWRHYFFFQTAVVSLHCSHLFVCLQPLVWLNYFR